MEYIMAKIHEEIVVIKLSKLIKDTENVGTLADNDTVASLEQVAQELVGSGVIVEVERA
jgi:hypothetical protein